jgi:protein-S-isoprenylcysteine O-methyltransferase Ste14
MQNKTLNYLTLAIVVIAFPLVIVAHFMSASQIGIHEYIGLALMVPSFILLIIARIQLGASFSVNAQANVLVTKGLYSKLRHPIYYISIVFLAGLAIFLSRPEMIGLCVVVIFLQLRRIRNEEKVLKEKFGQQYIEYRKKTWF